jgi:hypothetical protein
MPDALAGAHSAFVARRSSASTAPLGHPDEQVGARAAERGSRSDLEAQGRVCLGVPEVFGQHR